MHNMTLPLCIFALLAKNVENYKRILTVQRFLALKFSKLFFNTKTRRFHSVPLRYSEISKSSISFIKTDETEKFFCVFSVAKLLKFAEVEAQGSNR